ncbi:sulfite exporter TauE/SafE family protein [Candidatus Thioglobus sp. NP1]|uniref:sulfite exporter TauE/SafE family protein n=1 Tax=Candidatus Thioglobus sp. NP1 TaxID=2508687 RepID=UPI000DED7C90|nr:sulfite exporter TauE/SafE family protein [Candidatus Thioglobus sp. NP1]AXE61156.1 permease [Candidatus Thioglobus sp. NP1]
MTFTSLELVLIAFIFTWIGFVRTGLGFGGAVLGLPILMLIGGSPIDWLPIIGIHLLFFSGITLSNSLKEVDWVYLKKSLPWILPAKIIGVIGLISLSPNIMTVIVYLITSLYALTWINNRQFISKKSWVNNILLFFGGYLSGTSLMGGVLLVAVYMSYVDIKRLRNTLFVLWFFLVSIKMAAFLAVGVFVDWQFSLMLIPVAALGHFIGLRVHDRMIQNDTKFKRWMGSVLILVCIVGLLKVFFN